MLLAVNNAFQTDTGSKVMSDGAAFGNPGIVAGHSLTGMQGGKQSERSISRLR
jgi:hypothetical protein